MEYNDPVVAMAVDVRLGNQTSRGLLLAAAGSILPVCLQLPLTAPRLVGIFHATAASVS
jgi:hypothetical protein